MIDKNMTITALRIWYRPGDVFEVRVLDAVTADWMHPHTESGYFDYDHIPAAADAIARLRAYRGAYATVNPVRPELLARACNRIRPVRREPTTADSDVPARRWLLIDCDPVRAAGVSSSDAEHDAALTRAKEIRNDLTALGWPQPILTDSGNGAQLMYRIDLPAGDGGLVQKCVSALALASDEAVAIDTTVHNPARIWRIPGTMNCKGDSIPDRPHRMARLLESPDELQTVSEEQLREAAAWDIPDAPAPSSVSPDFNIDEWIAKFCPELGKPLPWKGGRKWIFPVCPFNGTHANKSAVLIQEPSGAIAFRCHHNSCAGNDWRKLRELKEPGCYERREEKDADISGLLRQKPDADTVIPPEPEIARPWRDITSADIRELLKGTFLGELADLYSCVTRPPLPIEASLLKAIVTAGCCLSGEASIEELQQRSGSLGGFRLIGADRARLVINTAGGQVCNVYAMLVANSSSGKDIGQLISRFARMNNPSVRLRDNEQIDADWFIGTSCSAEGLAKILMHKPNGLLIISEMKNWFNPNHWQGKATSFLTETFGQGYFDQNFSDRGRGVSSRRVDYCCPNIIANIQPDVFEKNADVQDLHTGFLSRFIFAVMPEFYGNPARFNSIKVLEQMRVIIDAYLRKSGVVELDETYADDIQKVFRDKCDPKLNPSWRRLCCEYYPRFMVMLSVNRDIATQGADVVITDEVKRKAWTLTLWFFAQAEKLLGSIMDCDVRSREMEEKIIRIFRIVRDQDRGDGVLTSTISHNASGSGTTSGDRGKILAELMERGWITLENSRYKVLNPPPGMEKNKVRKNRGKLGKKTENT